jgi:hypothetical protein
LDEALPGETVTAVAAADPPDPDGAELNDPDATRVIQLPSAANQT